VLIILLAKREDLIFEVLGGGNGESFKGVSCLNLCMM